MNRTLSNTFAVLIVTVFTALAIFMTVELAGLATALSGGTATPTATAATVSSSSASSGNVMVCPRTGCTATYCHAMQ